MTDETILNRDLHEAPASSTGSIGPNTGQTFAGAPVASDRPGNKADEEGIVPLFSGDESRSLRSRWENLQVGFVDEPRRAVEQADQLVTEAVNGLSKGFSAQQERLEQQWHRDQNVSTEELRIAFRRYRAFFERLLSV